jgi:hypothetical protein
VARSLFIERVPGMVCLWTLDERPHRRRKNLGVR